MSLSARVIKLERKRASIALANMTDRQLAERIACVMAELISIDPDDGDVRGWVAEEAARLGLDPAQPSAQLDAQVIAAMRAEAKAL